MKLLKSLAPEFCPSCDATNAFTIYVDAVACRRCGHRIPRHTAPAGEDGAEPLAPEDYYQPRETLRARYGLTHVGDVDRWARAAYDTGQDCIHRQDWEGAVKAFKRALDAQDDFIDAHLMIAKIINDPPRQRDHLTSVLAQQPSHPEAVRELMILDGKLDPHSRAADPYAAPVLRRAGAAVSASGENLRCPRCNSNVMTVDEATGLFECRSCGFVDDSKPPKPRAESSLLMAMLERRSKPVQWVIGKRLLHCNSCGAERTIPAKKLSDVCPFCDSKQVIETDALGSFQQPDILIPFALNRKEAIAVIKQRLAGWGERLRGWFTDNRIERASLEGVFLPYWMFDATLEIRKTFAGDVTYSRENISTFSGGYQSYTTADAVNNAAICAVTSPEPLLTDRLGAFDTGPAVSYDASLLAAHAAELYSIDFDKASIMARKNISQAMRRKHDETVQQGTRLTITTSVKHMNFQLTLAPVWVGAIHEMDGDIRPVLVNGQSGRVVIGKTRRPVD